MLMLIHMDTLLLGAPVFISIHLMLMLIPYNHRTEIENIYFNTSHVNVNLKSHKG